MIRHTRRFRAGVWGFLAVACGGPVSGAPGPQDASAEDATGSVDGGPDGGSDARVTPPPGQYPIQVILNVHNHSMASMSKQGEAELDPAQLHCTVLRWLRVANGWLRLANLAAPAGLSDVKFSVMLDGHFTAWNTYHLGHQTPGGDDCQEPLDFDSPFIDRTTANGEPTANAAMDLPALVAAGHEIGHHTHCHVRVEENNPDHLFWANGNAAQCESNAALGNQVLEQVHEELVKGLQGTGYAPSGLHQNMGDLAWREDHGYRTTDLGFDGVYLKNIAHVLWNPYRPCCAKTDDSQARCALAAEPGSHADLREAGQVSGCDPDAAFLLGIPEQAQAGEFNPHSAVAAYPTEMFYERKIAYGSNNGLPQMKKTFWLIWHERRLWELLGLPRRVWVIGWATHDSRLAPRQMRYDSGYDGGVYPAYDPNVEVEGEGTLPQFFGWLAATFMDAASPLAADGMGVEFATFSEVEARFEEWEGSAAGSPSVGQTGYGGPTASYPYELKFNRLLGPGYVALTGTASGRLVFDVHDPEVYDMSTCVDPAPYTYDKATGAATLLASCSNTGAVVERYVEVWGDGQADVASACGGFTACADPWVPVLAYSQDDPAAAKVYRASSVPVTATPSLVACSRACCGAEAACGDAGWKP